MVTAGTAYIRQLPGGSNSLGRVKFMFPNTFDVYLHDSPVQSDFARARRDQSHGCVRLSDPLGLAAVLLRDQPDWDTTRITAAMKGARPTRVALTRPVPVYLFYATVVAQDDGGVQFYDDVYGADASLAALLRAGGTPSVVTDAALTAESGPPAY
jgi:murein L,D-transpeptidase YcbB/YkuD